MSDVRFAYVPGEDVLRDVSFEARRGEAIGIVGPSGAGKSSLVQIMLRLRVPAAGTLLINGEDAALFRRADWQRRVAYVPQTPQLIWGTVADNIRFHRPEITDAQVEDAARKAHIHDEILSWPQGYRTVVGQRASAVSGGQRQRLCLARALAGSPDVLILDEPTSALDVRSEQAVQQSLEEVKDDVLLFLVAHRLSTLSVCDRVMVIVEGRLEAIDEPAALRERNDFYREVSEITRYRGVG
jgi:ATP-binding cassette, subfamily B, bacterial